MKKLLAVLLASVLMVSIAHATETKKVCVEQKDAKTGKVKEVCKTIKVHKKFEGTKVPEKAPAKKK
jgi:hypothetical protein